MFVMKRPDRKSTVLFAVFGTASLLSFFLFSDNQMILMPANFFVGYCVMSINVYIILWVDQFGMFSFKTAFLSLINLAKALGVSFGLLLNFSFTPDGYKKSFLVEIVLLLAIGFALVPLHQVYFVSDLLLYKGKFGEEEFKWKAKTQKEGGEEDNQSCEGAESIYRYRKSGASTQEFSVQGIRCDNGNDEWCADGNYIGTEGRRRNHHGIQHHRRYGRICRCCSWWQ